MDNRIYDIEGSYYKDISDKLIECVVHKEITYEPSLFIRKGVIKKAEVDNFVLKICVSDGPLIPCLLITFFVILMACLYFAILG